MSLDDQIITDYIVAAYFNKISNSFGNNYSPRNCSFRPYTAIALKMEAVSTSETSASLYQTTRRNIPKDSSSYSSPRKPEILLTLTMV
jgi:hypothetical protein